MNLRPIPEGGCVAGRFLCEHQPACHVLSVLQDALFSILQHPETLTLRQVAQAGEALELVASLEAERQAGGR